MNTKVLRGADFGSDNELLMSNIRVKFKANELSSNSLSHKYNIEKLKMETVKTNFRTSVENKFSLLEGVEDMDELWMKGRDEAEEHLRGREEAEEHLGGRKLKKQQ